MNKNLYGLMNWPEIEGIVYAECDKPKELLGAHVTGKGLLIQIMRPDAVAVKLHIDGRKTAVNMEKVDESGFFAVCAVIFLTSVSYSTDTLSLLSSRRRQSITSAALSDSGNTLLPRSTLNLRPSSSKNPMQS